MENDIVVKMENISKYYGNISALNNANLYLRKGEVLGIVGDNAAGKSTITKSYQVPLYQTKVEYILTKKKKFLKAHQMRNLIKLRWSIRIYLSAIV